MSVGVIERETPTQTRTPRVRRESSTGFKCQISSASLAKRDPVSVEQVNLLRVEGEADHFSDAYAAWPP